MNITAIEQMPETPCPANWTTWRCGSVVIRLDSDSQEFVACTKALGGAFAFGKRNGVVVGLPHLTQVEGALHQVVENAVDNVATLRDKYLKVYAASPAQFSWLLSNGDVSRLRQVITLKRLACMPELLRAEYHDHGEIQGILLIWKRGFEYQWFTRDGQVVGVVQFPEASEPADLDLVRSICCSLEFLGGTCPHINDVDQIRRLLEKL